MRKIFSKFYIYFPYLLRQYFLLILLFIFYALWVLRITLPRRLVLLHASLWCRAPRCCAHVAARKIGVYSRACCHAPWSRVPCFRVWGRVCVLPRHFCVAAFHGAATTCCRAFLRAAVLSYVVACCRTGLIVHGAAHGHTGLIVSCVLPRPP